MANNNTKSENAAVKYFYHFQKDFIKPYGLAHDIHNFSGGRFHQKISKINCEYVVRPQVATAFAESVLRNVEYSKENLEVLEKELLQAFLNKIKKFREPLKVLKTKFDTAVNF